MLDFEVLNYWAIAAAVLVNIVVGSLWYSPLGFGKIWSKLTKVNLMKMPKAEANRAIALVALGAVVQTVALALLVDSLAMTFLDGVRIGLVVWAGFTAATTIGDTLYARRSWKLWLINSGFFLVVLPISGGLITVLY